MLKHIHITKEVKQKDMKKLLPDINALSLIIPKINNKDVYYCNDTSKKLDLPKNIKHVVISGYIRDNLDKSIFPKTITHVTLNCNFHDKLKKNMLPNNLKYLKFAFSYDEIIDKDVLPTKLKYLIFKQEYNKKIGKNVLPKSLICLIIGNRELDFTILPESLLYLSVDRYTGNRTYDFPSSLIYLDIGCDPIKLESDVLPDTLKYLTLHGDMKEITKTNMFPSSLISLTFSSRFDQPIDSRIFPESLLYLKLGDEFDHVIKKNILPSKLTHLYLGKKFNSMIENNALPETLQVLQLNFTPSGKNIFKNLHSLNRLIMGSKMHVFDFDEKSLPKTLKKISIEDMSRDEDDEDNKHGKYIDDSGISIPKDVNYMPAMVHFLINQKTIEKKIQLLLNHIMNRYCRKNDDLTLNIYIKQNENKKYVVNLIYTTEGYYPHEIKFKIIDSFVKEIEICYKHEVKTTKSHNSLSYYNNNEVYYKNIKISPRHKKIMKITLIQ